MNSDIGRIEREFMLKELCAEGRILSFASGAFSGECRALPTTGAGYSVSLLGSALPPRLGADYSLRFLFRGQAASATGRIESYEAPLVRISLDGDWRHEAAGIGAENGQRGPSGFLAIRDGERVIALPPLDPAPVRAENPDRANQAIMDCQACLADFSAELGIDIHCQSLREADPQSSLEDLLIRESKSFYLPDCRGPLPEIDLSPYPDRPFMARGDLRSLRDGALASDSMGLFLPSYFRNRNFVSLRAESGFALSAGFPPETAQARKLPLALMAFQLGRLYDFRCSDAFEGGGACCLDFRPSSLLLALPDGCLSVPPRRGDSLGVYASYARRQILFETRVAAAVRRSPWLFLMLEVSDMSPEDIRYLFESVCRSPLTDGAADFLLP
jgi:hypothetical protein